MSKPIVSIIICTANRAADLTQTLNALRDVCIPADLPTELIVVDNASTDNTAEVAQECRLPNVPVWHIYEGRRGKGYAYNRGMAEAQGEVLLFTDDDVRPPQNWVAGMAEPILSGQADALVGGVKLAPHLERGWMQNLQHSWLASTEEMEQGKVGPQLVGANMAFGRHVPDKVPAFDPELGPGALGFADETLFSFQLQQAGYRLAPAFDVAVEHHFDPSRLTRASFLDAARKHGRSLAYVRYHWEHSDLDQPRLRLAKLAVRRFLRRLRVPRPPAEGMAADEMMLEMHYHMTRHFLHERTRPRNYEKQGLVKRTHE